MQLFSEIEAAFAPQIDVDQDDVRLQALDATQRPSAVGDHADNPDTSALQDARGSGHEVAMVVDHEAPQRIYPMCHVPSVGTARLGAIPASCNVVGAFPPYPVSRYPVSSRSLLAFERSVDDDDPFRVTNICWALNDRWRAAADDCPSSPPPRTSRGRRKTA